VGRDRDRAQARLETVQISLVESLSEAVTQAVALSKVAVRNS